MWKEGLVIEEFAMAMAAPDCRFYSVEQILLPSFEIRTLNTTEDKAS